MRVARGQGPSGYAGVALATSNCLMMDRPTDPPVGPVPPVSEPDREVSARFGADVRRAVEVCRSTPALPALTTVFAVLTAWGSSQARGHALVGLIGLAFVGWVGSERLWFLRAYSGRTLSVGSALRASISYWPRVVVLSLLVAVVALPLGLPIIVVIVHAGAAAHGTSAHLNLSLWTFIYSAVLSLIADFALTFVTRP